MPDDFGDWEDFAIVGGIIGFIEDEDEEDRRLRQEVENDCDDPLDD